MLRFGYDYLYGMLGLDIEEDLRQTEGQINEILSLLAVKAHYILEQLIVYGVPKYIVRALARRVIRFVMANAAYLPGEMAEKSRALVNKFFAEDPMVVYILINYFSIPHGVISYFVQETVMFTLENIVTIYPEDEFTLT